jgi:DDE family transposase
VPCSDSALRQTEGLIGSIIRSLGLDLAIPDHSTLSRRAGTLELTRPSSKGGPMHLLVDSTGLKLSGAGEWLVEKHGTSRRRSWRKLHIGVDCDTGRIAAAALTTNDTDDASQVGLLLDQADGSIGSFTGDGAYDQDAVYDEVAARHPDIPIIVPPRSSAVPSRAVETKPTQRDRHLQVIAEHGRMAWQKASGYNWRALVEADIGRWKRVIGHALRSRRDGARLKWRLLSTSSTVCWNWDAQGTSASHSPEIAWTTASAGGSMQQSVAPLVVRGQRYGGLSPRAFLGKLLPRNPHQDQRRLRALPRRPKPRLCSYWNKRSRFLSFRTSNREDGRSRISKAPALRIGFRARQVEPRQSKAFPLVAYRHQRVAICSENY